MKNFLLAGCLFFAVGLLAQETDVKNYNTEHIQQFYYKKGLRDGAEKGYKNGYRDALRASKKQLRLWATKIMALESGKYLKEYAGKITNPEIYQIKNGNEIKVVVKGCKIEKPLTPDEIIDLPQYPIDANGNYKFKYYNIDETASSPLEDGNNITNSADVVGRDGNGFYSNRPSSPYANKASYYYLPNSRSMRKKLDVLNYSYAIEDNKIKVIFNSEKEKNSFLNKADF